MDTRTKIWLVIAGAIMLLGIVIFGGVMSMINWDFAKLSTVKYETNEFRINESFENISIITDTANISFAASENSAASVVCHEQKNVKHSVFVKDGTLTISVTDTRKWYEYIGISFASPKITLYLPQGEYTSLTVKESTGNIEIPKDYKFDDIDILTSTGGVTSFASASGAVKIMTSTGDIHIEGISAGALDLSVSTGRITVSSIACEGDVKVGVSTGKTYLTDTVCKNLTSSGNTGDIFLNNVIAKEKFSIVRSTGDVKFDGCDAAEIFAETDTGNVTGTLLSDKVFIVRTDTGKIDVPRSVTGGRCEITTDTGDIKIKIK